MRKSSGLALAALALAAAPLPAAAAPMITFANLGLISGNVAYAGNGGPAAGHTIAINTIAGAGTPTNAGVALKCNNCYINFTTGNNLTEGPSAWTFAGGGSFTITGRAVQGGQVIATGTLLTGSFTDTPTFLAGGTGRSVFSGIGFDTKNPALLAFYGLASTNFRFTDANGFQVTNVGQNGSFRGLRSDTSTVGNTPVPEPATLALLGGGLAGLGLVLRRRKGEPPAAA